MFAIQKAAKRARRNRMQAQQIPQQQQQQLQPVFQQQYPRPPAELAGSADACYVAPGDRTSTSDLPSGRTRVISCSQVPYLEPEFARRNTCWTTAQPAEDPAASDSVKSLWSSVRSAFQKPHTALRGRRVFRNAAQAYDDGITGLVFCSMLTLCAYICIYQVCAETGMLYL